MPRNEKVVSSYIGDVTTVITTFNVNFYCKYFCFVKRVRIKTLKKKNITQIENKFVEKKIDI